MTDSDSPSVDKETTQRRPILKGLGAVLAMPIAAGCGQVLNAGDRPDAENGTATPTTATQTATPGISEQTIEATIATAQAKLETAFRRLSAVPVVEDHALVASSAGLGQFAPETVRKPAQNAREELQSIATAGKGETAERINLLLTASNVAGHLAFQFQYLDEGFRDYERFTNFYRQNDLAKAQTAIQSVQRAFAEVGRHGEEITTGLETIAESSVTIGVAAFHRQKLQAEQDVLSDVVYELTPALRGYDTYIRGLRHAKDANAAYENGKWTTAAETYRRAQQSMFQARVDLTTALERDVRIERGRAEAFACAADALRVGFGLFADAADAHLEGDSERANDLEQQAEEKLAEAEACGTTSNSSTPTPTPTPSGTPS